MGDRVKIYLLGDSVIPEKEFTEEDKEEFAEDAELIDLPDEVYARWVQLDAQRDGMIEEIEGYKE